MDLSKASVYGHIAIALCSGEHISAEFVAVDTNNVPESMAVVIGLSNFFITVNGVPLNNSTSKSYHSRMPLQAPGAL